MSHYNQTSAHTADKILNGTHAFVNQFNKGKANNHKISIEESIHQFNNSSPENKKTIAKAIFVMGKAAVITNTPYYAGMSEIIISHRLSERNFIKNINNCYMEAIIADNQQILDFSKLENLVRDTLISLDKLSISTLKRNRLINIFHETFLSINDNNENLKQSYNNGLKLYKEHILFNTLAKFSLNEHADLNSINDNTQDPTI